MKPSTFRPDVTVATVVECDGRYLLVEERVRGLLVLNQPAGHLEAGESLVTAATRETLEETAWEVEILGLLGIYQWRSSTGTEFLRFLFRAKPLRHLPERALDVGIERILWLDLNELRDRKDALRSPLVLLAVEDALDARMHWPLNLLHRVE